VLDEVDSTRRASNSSSPRQMMINLRTEAKIFPNMRLLVMDDGAGAWWPSWTYAVGALPEDTVRRAVDDAGFDGGALTERQVILLSVPLHLSMLSVTVAGSGRQPLPFQNATELFDAFWEKKQQECAGLGLPADRCQRMVERLCEEIDRRGTLFVPEAALEDCRADAAILTRAGVLLFVEGKCGFFHDAFYDFANAHRHIDGEPVAKYLRQTMRLQRDRDFLHYCRDLESLLNSTEVPDSAKTAAIDFLKWLEDPTAEEWNIVMRFVDSTAGKITGDALQIFVSNDRWFELATESGAVHRWNAKWKDDVDSWYSFLLYHYHRRKGSLGTIPQKADH
jgi:hypothetical protein